MSEDKTKEELYDEASELDIQGRSDMNKEELEKAVAEKKEDVDAEEREAEQIASDPALEEDGSGVSVGPGANDAEGADAAGGAGADVGGGGASVGGGTGNATGAGEGQGDTGGTSSGN